jgi:hypothetical protein
MRFVSILIVIIIIVLFTGCASNKGYNMPKVMPDDFAFSVRFGVGSKNVIDSYNGTVTKDLILAGTAEANVTFTNEEMLSIYEKMKTMNVLEPKDFNDDMNCRVTPYGEDIWKIRINGEEKTIQWSGKYCGKTEDAKQFIDLRNFVLDIVKEKNEYKELAEPKGGYA